jgi:hypothetical protein
VIEFLLSQFVAGDEHQLVTYDPLAVCALRNDGRFSLAHHGRQRSASHEFEKEHVKCVVHRIPNDRMTVASQTQPGRQSR